MQPAQAVVRVWDLPTRVFHWALAGTLIGLLVTSKVGGEALAWHARFGHAAGSLLLFRLAWGFVGGHWSRFRAFAPSRRAALAYLRGDRDPLRAGHSPLGALAVYALMAFLVAQVATGLFSADKDDFAGPLAAFVSNRAVHFFTGYHKNIGQYVLVALVLLHVAAIAYYRVKRQQRLTVSMVHGNKLVDAGTPASADDAGSRTLALVIFLACAGLMGWVSTLG